MFRQLHSGVEMGNYSYGFGLIFNSSQTMHHQVAPRNTAIAIVTDLCAADADTGFDLHAKQSTGGTNLCLPPGVRSGLCYLSLVVLLDHTTLSIYQIKVII